MNDIINRLQLLLDNEARSCSVDFGCVTPVYVYRMWGGAVAIDEIEKALVYLKAKNYRFYDHMHLCDLCMVSNDESFPLAGDGGGLAY